MCSCSSAISFLLQSFRSLGVAQGHQIACHNTANVIMDALKVFTHVGAWPRPCSTVKQQDQILTEWKERLNHDGPASINAAKAPEILADKFDGHRDYNSHVPPDFSDHSLFML